MSTDFGRDIMFRDGDLVLDREVTGIDLVAQSCVIRLSTERGSVIDSPDDGLDLVDMLEDDLDPRLLARIPVIVRSQLLRDERLLAVTVRQVSEPDDEELELDIRGTTADGAFRRVLAVGDVTLEVLR